MTTRCNLITRAAAFLILTLALLSLPSMLSAQVCACNYYIVRVDSTVSCSVTFCWALSPVGTPECRTIPPGGSIRVPCPVHEGWLRLCNGSSYVIIGNNPGALCTEGLVVAPFCCVRACFTVDPATNCTVIQISPWNCAGGGC